MPIRVLSSAANHVRFGSFDNPAMVKGGYAVLSHRWEDVEQPYEETLVLAQKVVSVDSPQLSTKVRGCHRLARTYGLSWFWVDAPCIDQRNSAELSEAIVSMYSWYAQATICFAYLVDVPPGDILREPGSAFRRSVYFRRGWTLQELIAPRRVVFFYNDWTVAGEKDELADLLEEITGIDHDILTSRRALSDVSVARRLSWSSQRETCRAEDKAYCLMGLFNIHMPVIYGEGNKAFGRLQAKILQEVRDHTLLAWSISPSPFDTAVDYPSQRTICPFAPSPAAFSDASHLVAVDMAHFVEAVAPLCRASNPEQTVLPCIGPVDHNGIKCRLPILYHGSTPLGALLACKEDHSPSSYVALVLRRERSLLPGIYGVETKAGPRESSIPLQWPPSRLLRVNLDLLTPHFAHQGVCAQKPALNLSFRSFYITTTPLSPPSPTLSSSGASRGLCLLSSPASTSSSSASSNHDLDDPPCADAASLP